ncbi:hypothetical protein [Blastococcus sp. TF02-09]|uniref:hypothetical protein n=1 Tax=Blastococcus sp. TF02-09 TaxID=2250576 RepID=UPI0011BF44F1|nr:hypothetical protein [Blastococcus sp. TF02-9]
MDDRSRRRSGRGAGHPRDDLATALSLCHRAADTAAQAEEWAVEAVRRLHVGQLPAYLRQATATQQLQYAVVRVVLEGRAVL